MALLLSAGVLGDLGTLHAYHESDLMPKGASDKEKALAWFPRKNGSHRQGEADVY